MKQEASQTQPQPTPTAAIPEAVEEKVKQVADTPQPTSPKSIDPDSPDKAAVAAVSAMEPPSLMSSPAGGSAQPQTNDATPAGIPVRAQANEAHDRTGAAAAEAAGTGVFAEPQACRPLQQPVPADSVDTEHPDDAGVLGMQPIKHEPEIEPDASSSGAKSGRPPAVPTQAADMQVRSA